MDRSDVELLVMIVLQPMELRALEWGRIAVHLLRRHLLLDKKGLFQPFFGIIRIIPKVFVSVLPFT